jgi:[acyl-carrier-protein] S-malonyltransferase
MSKTAFLFPGQGSQKCGMGKDFYEQSKTAKVMFDQASEALGFDMRALCFEPNEKLDQTEYTQAALVTASLAMARTAMEKGLRADITAGLSLGEYAAIAVAGGMSDEDAIRTTRVRGILMQQAVPRGEGAMAAVLGMETEKIEAVLSGISGVTIANYNCPGQIVITGRTFAVEQAKAALLEAGARRVLALNVSGPFHSPMLCGAGEALQKELDHVRWRNLEIPYVANVTAETVTEIGQTKTLLAQQVASPVRWEQSIRHMIASGVKTFVEIGPGKTLSGFVKKIDRGVRCFSIQTVEDLESVLSQLQDM